MVGHLDFYYFCGHGAAGSILRESATVICQVDALGLMNCCPFYFVALGSGSVVVMHGMLGGKRPASLPRRG